jgi:hypothetical protein
VVCIACGDSVLREDAREYDKEGDRWNRRDKEFEYLCTDCDDDICHQPRDGLESLLLRIEQDDLDREALLDALQGLIQIIEESGSIRPAGEFSEFSNEEKFVALLLARRAADDLRHIDAIGAESNWFTEYIDVNNSRIRQYAGDHDFVENDSDVGGYHIPGFRIHDAIDVIEQEQHE